METYCLAKLTNWAEVMVGPERATSNRMTDLPCGRDGALVSKCLTWDCLDVKNNVHERGVPENNENTLMDFM